MTCLVGSIFGGEGGIFDQRGESRPLTIADACDVGSVEFKETDIKTSFYVIPLENGNTVVIPL
ncbi:MAG: hypothetical protein KTR16_17310, partial [Acidiferrobacterales bacterium]|nr:hypothetical protein [Acidiferrobacterales bacterium]